MQFNTLALAFVLASAGLAKKLDYDDIPQRCLDVCTPVAELEQRCDDTNKPDNDFLERQCVCTAQDANTMIPNCANCIWENGGKFDNDAEELVRECGFNAPAPSGVRPNGPPMYSGAPRPDGNGGQPGGGAGQGNPGNGQGNPGNGQGNPNNGQGNPNNGQGNPNNGQGNPNNGQGNPNNGQGNGQVQGNGQGNNNNNQPVTQGSTDRQPLPNAATTPTATMAVVAGGLVGFAAFLL
ncbi:hypothetical protein yc1106_04823 [Curvularia clavata]|uniref:Uncharacterized protein n=1 Tax=Curvularia clavata TaxID=95742 RepID=A0A9Q8Z7Q1_CURCL|nr:hypothetical protein yc1106_04823 [Curvularia clavata]